MKYVTNQYGELYGQYTSLKDNIAYKDIVYFLEEAKKTAMNTLKSGEIKNAEARGVWQLVDKFNARLKNLGEEAIKEINNKEPWPKR